jgi:hypothetical protein
VAAMFISDKADFKPKLVKRGKEGHNDKGINPA